MEILLLGGQMGQVEIIKLLEKVKPKKLTSHEIMKGTGGAMPSTVLKKLRKQQAVKFASVIHKDKRRFFYWIE